MNTYKTIGGLLTLAGIGMLLFAIIATIEEQGHGGVAKEEQNTLILFITLAILSLVGGLILYKMGKNNKQPPTENKN